MRDCWNGYWQSFVIGSLALLVLINVPRMRDGKLREKMGKAGHASNRYDCFDKWWTKQCGECPKRISLDGNDLCTIGVAWKILYRNDKPRKCALISGDPP